MNFSGNCQWNPPSDRCRDDGASTGANGVLSIGPDEGGSCTLFKEAGCKGTEIETLRFPGLGNIAVDYASFNCKADAVNTTSNVDVNDEANVNSNSTLKIRDSLLRVLARNNEDQQGKPEKEGFMEAIGRLAKNVLGGN